MEKVNNVSMLPTAKTFLYHNRIRLNKETKNEVMNLVYDNLPGLNKKQSKNLDRRLEICEELKKLLPQKHHKLLLEYEELNLKEFDTVLEQAISYVIKNEKEINDVLVNF